MRTRLLVAVVAAGALAAAAVVTVRALSGGSSPPEQCVASARGESYAVDLEQAANAATIAAVGKRLGLPDHAVTVALAAALQESKLRNLTYGDRDSLGLFQQRPSQGWGTRSQILDPVYAATAFYSRLRHVDGWAALPVDEAAQRVQRSAGGYAYAQWDPQARVMAQALTGEVPAGLACSYRAPEASGTSAAPLSVAAGRELGTGMLTATHPAARGWTVASWVVAHAYRYGVSSVQFTDLTWTRKAGVWRTHHGTPSTRVVVTYLPGTSGVTPQ